MHFCICSCCITTLARLGVLWGLTCFLLVFYELGLLAVFSIRSKALAWFHCHKFSYLKGSVGETVICRMLKNDHCNYMFPSGPNRILGFILCLKDIWWFCQISFLFFFHWINLVNLLATEQRHENASQDLEDWKQVKITLDLLIFQTELFRQPHRVFGDSRRVWIFFSPLNLWTSRYCAHLRNLYSYYPLHVILKVTFLSPS